MVSSGGGGGYSSMAQAMGPATPMANIPIAGQPGTSQDPYDYGRYQSFLPAPGSGLSATGLKPEMFTYRTPSQIKGGDMTGGPTEADNLRAQLAAAMAAQAAKPPEAPAQPGGMTPYDWTYRFATEGRGGG